MPTKMLLAARQKSVRSGARHGRRAARRARSLHLEPLEDRRLMAFMPGVNLSTGTQLTTYTLALATTAEFTQSAGGTAAAKAILNRYVSELNKIYEPELAVTFQLSAQNDLLISTDAATDGYTNGAVGTMINENTGVINTRLNGNPNNDAGYDFGHVLGIGNDSGLAGVGDKGRGATDFATADASAGSIQTVAHELGHQMSASHTYNGVARECGNGSRSSSTAVEPGSGSTVMAYQSICDADNLPVLPGDGVYFNAVSFDEIITYLTNAIQNRGTDYVGCGGHNREWDQHEQGRHLAVDGRRPDVSASARFSDR